MKESKIRKRKAEVCKKNRILTKKNKRLKQRVATFSETIKTVNEKNEELQFQLDLALTKTEMNTTVMQR